jgi:hypothetical protein
MDLQLVSALALAVETSSSRRTPTSRQVLAASRSRSIRSAARPVQLGSSLALDGDARNAQILERSTRRLLMALALAGPVAAKRATCEQEAVDILQACA